MVIDGDMTNKNKYINSIYEKFLTESKEINWVKNSENSFDVDQDLISSPTHFKTPYKWMSPGSNSIVQNEYSIKMLKQSFNNMTDTIKNIKKANRFPK